MAAYAQGQAANKKTVGHVAQLIRLQGMKSIWTHFEGHRQGFQTDVHGLALLTQPSTGSHWFVIGRIQHVNPWPG
jgi:hypothetical protein